MNAELSMSEVVDSVVSSSPSTQGVGSGGTLLRQAREAAGMEVEAVATALKVPVVKVLALEANQWDAFPDTVFIRALATSMCRILKLDPGPVLAQLPSSSLKPLPNAEGINAPFRESSHRIMPGTSMLKQVSLPLVLVVLALGLAAAALIIFLPSMSLSASAPAKSSNEGVAMSPVVMAPQVPDTAANTPVVVASAPALPVVSAAPAPSPTASAAVVPAAVEVSASAAASAPTTTSAGIVVFKTSAPSWIYVTDAKGVKILERLTAAGDTVSVSGAVPLSIVVGRADVTQVEVRGKPFSLASSTRDGGVARFEVK